MLSFKLTTVHCTLTVFCAISCLITPCGSDRVDILISTLYLVIIVSINVCTESLLMAVAIVTRLHRPDRLYWNIVHKYNVITQS